MEEDRKIAKEDLYEGRVAWLDAMTWGLCQCFKRDATIANNSNGDRKQLANLVNPKRQPCMFGEIFKFFLFFLIRLPLMDFAF